MVQWVKNPPSNVGDQRDGFLPWVRNIPWRRKWQPASVFLAGKSHGKWSMAGYNHGVTKSQTGLNNGAEDTIILL